jgi:hypothetical protein
MCHWVHSSQHFKWPSCLHHQGIFGLPNPDDEGTAILWNTVNYSTLTVSHQRRTELSATLPQAPHSRVYDIQAHICTVFQQHHLIYLDTCTSVLWDYPHPCNHTLCHDSWTSMVDSWLKFLSFKCNSALTVKPYSMESKEHLDSPKDDFHNLSKNKSGL